jgi:hypothetical protein
MDLGFKHPECDMYPSEEGDVRMVLGVKTSRRERVMAEPGTVALEEEER